MAQYQITNRPAPIDFECNNDIILRTVQNAKNLLMCRMGEVPYDRYRTPDVESRYFAAQGRYSYFALPGRYNNMSLPDVEIVDGECAMDENGDIIITATIEVTIDE